MAKSYLKRYTNEVLILYVVAGGGGQDKHNEDKSNGYQPRCQDNNNKIITLMTRSRFDM